MGAGLLVALGRRDEGLRWGESAIGIDPNDPGVLYNIACLNSLAGRPEEAIGYLEKSVNAGFSQKEWIENDSDLDAIRSAPRFQALLKRLGR